MRVEKKKSSQTRGTDHKRCRPRNGLSWARDPADSVFSQTKKRLVCEARKKKKIREKTSLLCTGFRGRQIFQLKKGRPEQMQAFNYAGKKRRAEGSRFARTLPYFEKDAADS